MRGRPFPTDSPIIVQVPHHDNILLGGGVLCVLNWGGRGGRKLSLCECAACSPVSVQPGAKPLQARSTACRSCRSHCAHPAHTAGQGGEADV